MENEICRQVEMRNAYIPISHDISSRSRNDGDEEHISFNENKEDFDDQSPIEQVALTVPTTDDPTIPVLTFRMWVLGILSCVILSFLNQFFAYRTEPLSISSIAAQIAVLPLGRLMAATITNKKFFAGSTWEFSLNPGPFNTKEHVLITIFANAGSGGVYATLIIDIVKIFYKRKLTFFVSLLLVMITQMLGYGWAGVFRKYLVESPTMWWPSNLVQVSLFRALHEKEGRPRGGLTRNQFFMTVLSCSFAYYVLVVPGYLFPMVTSLSWICWAFPHSVLAHQLGSGLHGLGVGCLGIDWSTISSFLGSPLATPWFATANIAVGFVLVMYVITPLTYWFNLYDAKTFPIFSDTLFNSTGQPYDIAGVIDSNFHLDPQAYEKNGSIHLTTFFAVTYGVGFAALSATLVHVLLFHGKDIWRLSLSAFRVRKLDVHTRLMRKYKQVPELWFTGILVGTIALSIFTCEYYRKQLQLPWWGVILACGVAVSFTLPVGVIYATTNQMPGLNIITEYIIGYVYPGRPVANVCFKTYGYISMVQALSFLGDFKLGHYMKVPPRAMFSVQIVGTVISGTVYLSAPWWIMPSDSPWTCPTDHVFYSASVIWGLIGPRRIFGNLGEYAAVNWFFLVGAIAPVIVWLFHKAYPNKQWITLINMPILIGATANMPPATAVNYTSWILMGFIFSFVLYRHKKDWWKRHNYVMSAGLDAGLAFMGVLLYFCLGDENISLNWWGANTDGCSLARCPAAEGCR